MKKLILKPSGWPEKLGDCPPGLFLHGDTVCFKSEYKDDHGHSEVFNYAGEYFWADCKNKGDVENIIVQPLEAEWVLEDAN